MTVSKFKETVIKKQEGIHLPVFLIYKNPFIYVRKTQVIWKAMFL